MYYYYTLSWPHNTTCSSKHWVNTHSNTLCQENSIPMHYIMSYLIQSFWWHFLDSSLNKFTRTINDIENLLTNYNITFRQLIISSEDLCYQRLIITINVANSLQYCKKLHCLRQQSSTYAVTKPVNCDFQT